jgi:hypothetical protein
LHIPRDHLERQVERAAGGDDAKILVEHKQGLANRIHDGLGERPAIFNVHERLIVGQNRSLFEERVRYHHRLPGLAVSGKETAM